MEYQTWLLAIEKWNLVQNKCVDERQISNVFFASKSRDYASRLVFFLLMLAEALIDVICFSLQCAYQVSTK